MSRNLCLVLGLAALSWAGCGGAQTHNPALASRDLPNGLRVVVVHFPGSTNVSL